MGTDVLTDVKGVKAREKALVQPWALPGTTDRAGTAQGDVGPCLGVLGLSPVPRLPLPFCCGRKT